MAWHEHRVSDIPQHVLDALRTAIELEHEPTDSFEDFAWIMAQESSGRVDSHNPHSSARGLFQLTRVNYHLLPHGAASFGNAVDECRGGIRYIRQRYHTAAHARQFWQSRHWY